MQYDPVFFLSCEDQQSKTLMTWLTLTFKWEYFVSCYKHSLPITVHDEEEVGCVIRFKDEYFPPPASLHLKVRYDNELSTTAVGDSEEMVSNVVQLKHEDDDDDYAESDDLGAPIVVAIPYAVNQRQAHTRDFVVKMRGRNDEEWHVVPTLALESSFDEHKVHHHTHMANESDAGLWKLARRCKTRVCGINSYVLSNEWFLVGWNCWLYFI